MAAALSANSSAAASSEELVHEILPDGRACSVTSTSLPAQTVPDDACAAPASGRDDTYRWLDTNHENAIAEDVTVNGNGAYGLVGWWLNNERASLYQLADDNMPEWSYLMPNAAFQIFVSADDSGDLLTATARGESLLVFSSGSSVPIRDHGYTLPYLSYYTDVSDNDATYVGAGSDGATGEVRVFDGDGTLRFVAPMESTPQGVRVSADGSVVVCNSRTFVKIWDAFSGAVRDSLPIPGETQQAAIVSGDGAILVTGGFARTVRVYQWDGICYASLWSYFIPATTWITALEISDDGSTIAVGTWTNPTGGAVVVFHSTDPNPLWIDANYGDYVPSVSITPNGARIAAGSWGRQGASVYNIVNVYERPSPAPSFAITDDAFPGVGSCMSVALGENGIELLAGGKAVHAREFGNGGWVMSIELPDPASMPSPEGFPARLQARPNPFRDGLRVDFFSPSSNDRWPGVPELSIVSPAGRIVRTLTAGGAGGWWWDGLDEAGRPAPAGTYFVRAAGSVEPARVIRLR